MYLEDNFPIYSTLSGPSVGNFLVWTRYEWLIVELKRVAKKLYYNDNVTLSTFYIYIIISDIFAIEIKISALSAMSLLQ